MVTQNITFQKPLFEGISGDESCHYVQGLLDYHPLLLNRSLLHWNTTKSSLRVYIPIPLKTAAWNIFLWEQFLFLMSVFLVANKIYSDWFKQKRSLIQDIKWLMQSSRRIDSKIGGYVSRRNVWYSATELAWWRETLPLQPSSSKWQRLDFIAIDSGTSSIALSESQTCTEISSVLSPENIHILLPLSPAESKKMKTSWRTWFLKLPIWINTLPGQVWWISSYIPLS